MGFNKLIICAVAALAMVSCTTTRENNLAYFKNTPQEVAGSMPGTTGDYGIKLITDDEVAITV